MNVMLGYIEVLSFLFVLILLGICISEIVFKKRTVSEVKRDFPRLLRNSAIAIAALIFFIWVLHFIGIDLVN